MGAWALLLAVVLGLAGPAAAAEQSVADDGPQANLARNCRSYFRVLPYLTHVTSSAIRINVVPEDSIDLRWSLSLGTDAAWGVRGQITATGVTADARTHGVAAPAATFTGLTAATEYKYQVECRASASSPWQLLQQAYFRTLRTNADDVYRIGLVSDTHSFQRFFQEQCPVGPAGLFGSSANPIQVSRLTVSNLGQASIDFLVDLGDTQMLDFSVPSAPCVPTVSLESGATYTFSSASADEDVAEINARYEVWLREWQPILAYKPYFQSMGNHDGIHGFGGAGSALLCGYSENNTAASLAGMQRYLGNYNDAYPNGSDAANFDGDALGAGAETQTDGLYYEFASGSLRWFMIDTTRYRSDDCSGCATVSAAGLYPGYVARAADTQYAGFGAAVPATAWPDNNTDTWEDNQSMGATQIGWFITRSNAKTETFGVVASHTPVAGLPGNNNCYYYQRGTVNTAKDGSGRRTTATIWDADGDGDLSEDHYLVTQMEANAIQLRLQGHDHQLTVCRKGDVHFAEIGTPQGGFVFGRVTTLNWMSNTTGADAGVRDIYDCDENGAPDFDPANKMLLANNPQGLDDPDMLDTVQNGGISGATGTANPGYGLLTINGTSSLAFEWVVADNRDLARNNDRIIFYGPILP